MASQSSPGVAADEASPVTVTDRTLLQVSLSSPRKKAYYSKISVGHILKHVSDMSQVEHGLPPQTTSVVKAVKKARKKSQPPSLSASSSSLPNLDYLSPQAATDAAQRMERLEYLNRLRLKLEEDLNRSLSEGLVKSCDAGIAGLEFEDMPALENMSANKTNKVKKIGVKECMTDAPSIVKNRNRKDDSRSTRVNRAGEKIKRVASEPSLEKLAKQKASRSLSPKPAAITKLLPESDQRSQSERKKFATKRPQGNLLEKELAKEKAALEKLTKPKARKRRVSPKPNSSKELPKNSTRSNAAKEKASKSPQREQEKSDAEFEVGRVYEKLLKGSSGRKSNKSKSPRRKTATLAMKEEEAKAAANLRLSELTDVFSMNSEIVDEESKIEKSKASSSRRKSPRCPTTPLKLTSSGLASPGTQLNSAPMKCTSDKIKPSTSMVTRKNFPRHTMPPPLLNPVTTSRDSYTVKAVPLKSPKDLSRATRSRASHSRQRREQDLMSVSAPGSSVRRGRPDLTSLSSSVNSARFLKETDALSSSLDNSFSVSQSRESLVRRDCPDTMSILSSVHSTRQATLPNPVDSSLSASQSGGRVRRRKGRRSASVTPKRRGSSVQSPVPVLVSPNTERSKSVTRLPLVRATTEPSQAKAQEMSESRRNKGGFNRFSISPVRARDPRTGVRSSLTSVVSQLPDPLGDNIETVVSTEASNLENGEDQTLLGGGSSQLSNRAPRSRLSAIDLKKSLQMVDTMSPSPSTRSKKTADSDLVSISVSSHAPSVASKVVVPFAQEIPKEVLKAQRKKAKANDPFSDLEFDTGFADLYEDDSEAFTAPT